MFDPYLEWLGIPKECRPVDYYRLLDLPRDVRDAEAIEEAAEIQMALVGNHREGPHAQHSTRILKEIKLAEATLLDPAKRQAYDQALRQHGLDKRARNGAAKSAKKSATKKDEPAPPSRRTWIWASAAAVLLLPLGGGGLAWWLRSGSEPSPQPPVVALAHVEAPAPAPAPAAVPEKPKEAPKVNVPAPAPKLVEQPPAPPIVIPNFKPPEIPPSPLVVKVPVPSSAAQAVAEKALRRLYAEDYAKSKPENWLALAAKLLQPGRENRKDHAAWYVLLREARDLAVRAERARLAIEAVNEIDKWFIIDAPTMRLKILQTLSQSNSEPAARAVAETALALAEQAVTEDNYEQAMRMIELAQTAAGKLSQKKKASQQVEQRKAEIEGYQRNHQAVVAARLKLKQQPDDPVANLVVGRQLCLFHGKWQEGLPYLAKGSDTGLKTLAQQDLAQPAETAGQLPLGDRWWNYADKLKDREETHCRRRATHWYELAQPKAVALEKAKVESRIAKVHDKAAARFVRLLPGSFYGRGVEDRILLLREGGGTMQTEEAVERGLKWIVDHQTRSGMWSLNHFQDAARCNCTEPGQKFDVAATAFGLLPLVGAGNTHAHGPYSRAVNKGLVYLLSQQKSGGNFSDSAYENALATIAVCEVYGLTHDRRLGGAAQRALDYIVRAQHSTGSWGYSAGAKGDTSVSGFQFTALKTGVYAGLKEAPGWLALYADFLDHVADPNGLGYGYNTPGTPIGTSAVGLFCRMYMGWGPSHPLVARGVGQLYYSQNITPTYQPGMYFVYYATQLMHHVGGNYWQAWNPKIRDWLLTNQDKGNERPHAHQEGSWSCKGDPWAEQGGRLMATSLALLTLEVYYLNIPLYNFGSAVMID
jgi:hypothetical protein